MKLIGVCGEHQGGAEAVVVPVVLRSVVHAHPTTEEGSRHHG